MHFFFKNNHRMKTYEFKIWCQNFRKMTLSTRFLVCQFYPPFCVYAHTRARFEKKNIPFHAFTCSRKGTKVELDLLNPHYRWTFNNNKKCTYSSTKHKMQIQVIKTNVKPNTARKLTWKDYSSKFNKLCSILKGFEYCSEKAMFLILSARLCHWFCLELIAKRLSESLVYAMSSIC